MICCELFLRRDACAILELVTHSFSLFFILFSFFPPQQTYYEILGVDQYVDAKALKKAYRKAALDYHPDKQKTEEDRLEAERIFFRVAKAYKVLKDPETRAEYNDRLDGGVTNFDNWNPEDEKEDDGSPSGFYGGFDMSDMDEGTVDLYLWIGLASVVLMFGVPMYLGMKDKSEKKKNAKSFIKSTIKSKSS